MLVVRGVLKDYDWGVQDGLASWAVRPSGGPQAELWFGAHPSGPSPVLDPAGRDTGQLLPDRVPAQEVPLLVKLLAAAAPLSIQVHPDAEQARRGWRRQQADPGLPAVYADDAEKTELLVALQPFHAHVGWRDPETAAAVLAGAGAPGEPVRALRAGDRSAAIRALLGMTAQECAPVLARLVPAAVGVGLARASVDALARVAATHPRDPGVQVAVLLEHVSLSPGDAVYVPAGVPHSYVDGLALEVMTSSDNVMRLGLTAKPVAVDEALAALRDGRQPVVLRAVGPAPLHPEGAPFAVRLVSHRAAADSGSYRLVLCLEGETTVTSDGVSVTLNRGRAAVLTAAEPPAEVAVVGRAALVTAQRAHGRAVLEPSARS